MKKIILFGIIIISVFLIGCEKCITETKTLDKVLCGEKTYGYAAEECNEEADCSSLCGEVCRNMNWNLDYGVHSKEGLLGLQHYCTCTCEREKCQ